MIVTVTQETIDRAYAGGDGRQRWHEKNRTRDAYGLVTNDPAAVHRQGALAELAVATLFGVEDEWVDVVDNYKELPSDIGGIPGLQVRSTYHPRGRLLLHHEKPDKDDHAFVLVRIVNLPQIEIVGWASGKYGRQVGHWPGPKPWRPCFAVPNHALDLNVGGSLRFLADNLCGMLST